MKQPDFGKLAERIGYTYKNEKLLEQALTHTSYVNELRINKRDSYERLEFLGDAVLEMISSDYFFRTCPNEPEGNLTKMRAAAVCEQALAITARDLELGSYILFGRGEEATGGRVDICLLSNNKKARVERFNKDVNVKYIFKAQKPYSRNYYAAAMKMHFSVKSVLCVGDQLFTDIYGGNLAGIHTYYPGQSDK